MESVPKKKILIVDDDPIIRKLVSSVLINAGYHIATADQGKEGLAQAINFQPDLIISDVLMPEMDGYEFVTRAQKSLGRKVPIMLLTSLNSVEQKLKDLRLGQMITW